MSLPTSVRPKIVVPVSRIVCAREWRSGVFESDEAEWMLKVAIARRGVAISLGRREPVVGRRSGLACAGVKLSAKIRIKICVGESRRRLAKIVGRPQVRLVGGENDGSCNFVSGRGRAGKFQGRVR